MFPFDIPLSYWLYFHWMISLISPWLTDLRVVRSFWSSSLHLDISNCTTMPSINNRKFKKGKTWQRFNSPIKGLKQSVWKTLCIVPWDGYTNDIAELSRFVHSDSILSSKYWLMDFVLKIPTWHDIWQEGRTKLLKYWLTNYFFWLV